MGAMPTESRRRAFVCYSRSDADLAKRVVAVLGGNLLKYDVLWDQKIAGGEHFNEAIRNFIAHSHVFVPVITPQASQRGWVHQEIGYAVGMDVEICPLLIDGAKPEGLTEIYQGIDVPAGADEQAIGDLILEKMKLRTVQYSDQRRRGCYWCANDRLERANLIGDAALTVTAMGRSGMVRHHGAYTSFSIPNADLTADIWLERHGEVREKALLKAEFKERDELEKHAKVQGCRLIVRPKLNDGNFCGESGRACRMKTLKDFLEKNPHEETYALIDPDVRDLPSQLLVGNWFSAESRISDSRLGYRQTVLTRHAPTVEEHREEFDRRFDRMLKEAGLSLQNCREATIDYLERELRKGK